MKTILILLACFIFAFATVVPHIPPLESRPLLTYKVSLNDPPIVRWAPIVRDFAQPLHRFMQYIDLLPIPKKFYDGVEWWARNQFKYQDFVAEVDALAKLSGYPFEKIFFYNFMYEFSTFPSCTGFVVRNDQGQIFHGRNLDFQMWELLARLLVNIEYYRDGKKIYSVDTVAASVFALTGVRENGFAINVDTRGAKSIEQDLISVIKNNAIPTCWLLRKVLEEESDYASAKKRLMETKISAPVYYILSGVKNNEGIVIERQPDSVHASYELTDRRWFLVQTNYDRDQQEPIIDTRRGPMQQRVEANGNKFTVDTVMQQMSTWPNFNIGTIMTTVIRPETGYHNTTAWYGTNPDPHQLSAM